MNFVQSIKDNITEVKNQIQQLKSENGIERDIIILGATKTLPKEVTDFIISEGLLQVIGENRVQELRDKYEPCQNISWHFIGALQCNKVKYIVDKVSLIHSLDSISLAKEIQKQAKKHSLVCNCLVQVNLGEEPSKSGVLPSELFEFLSELKSFENLKIEGLCGVVPKTDNAEKAIEYFSLLKKLYGEASLIKSDNFDFKFISSGMSNDYKLAIVYGDSNIVRLGEILFGKRSYTNV